MMYACDKTSTDKHKVGLAPFSRATEFFIFFCFGEFVYSLLYCHASLRFEATYLICYKV